MEEKYLEVLSKNILNDVKRYVKYNNIFLEKEKETITDKKMLKIIKSVVENANIIFLKEDEYNKINIIPSLMQYYVALYNDNLDLLHKLLDEEFNWQYYENKKMNLFVLDQRISSKFTKEEYIEILKHNTDLIENFYNDLNSNINNKEIDLNKIIEKFCNIIKKNKDIGTSQYSYNNRVDNLFTIDLLINFTENEILNLNDAQKYNLKGFKYKNDKETNLKLDLIKKYNYSKILHLWNDFSKYFTIEEILNLTDDDIKVYQCVFTWSTDYDNSKLLTENAINKIKIIKTTNPTFNHQLQSIVYDVLSNEQIISLSENGVDYIHTLCFNYHLKNINEKTLRTLIKEAYYKDKVKRNIKKLIKK